MAGRRPVQALPAHHRNPADFAKLLLDEIRQGIHPWNTPLPTAKEFAARWRCHPQTASKVLRSIEAAGAIRRLGRRWLPVRPSRKRRSSVPDLILCLGAPDGSGGVRMDSDRELEFWRELGTAAAQAGIGLTRQPWTGDPIRLSEETIGVVASTWHIPDPSTLYRRLVRIGLPACVWVEDPTYRNQLNRVHSRIGFHDQGYGENAGALVADHLIALGHRHIAWLSPWQASGWSRNRLDGIARAAREAGAKLDTFCLEGISEWDRLGPAWSDERFSKIFPGSELERAIGGSAEGLRRSAILELGWNRIRSDFSPLAEAALRSGATAWIGSNDSVALMSRTWLVRQGLRVPGDISLCGFDDTSEALRANLTSFRFATPPMVRAMLQQILSETAQGISRHEGLVVSRDSTVPPSERIRPSGPARNPDA